MRSSTLNAQSMVTEAMSIPLDVQLMNVSARVLFVVAVLAFIAWTIAGLVRLPAFSLGGIEVTGDTGRYTPSIIRTTVLPQLKGNFFTVDLAKSRASFEALPWIRHAIVRRIWPNRLQVTLEEHRTAAIWHREDDDDQLVNTEGEIFDANVAEVEDDRLPTLSGPDAASAPRVLQMYRQLNGMFGALDAHIDTLRLSDRGSWTAILDSGAQIELGRGEVAEVVARVTAFMGTVGEVLQRYQRPLEYADLRYPRGYALRLHGISTNFANPSPSH